MYEPNITRRAAEVSMFLNRLMQNESITRLDNRTMTILTIPVIPNAHGSTQMGISSIAYRIDCTAAYLVCPPVDGNILKPALV